MNEMVAENKEKRKIGKLTVIAVIAFVILLAIFFTQYAGKGVSDKSSVSSDTITGDYITEAEKEITVPKVEKSEVKTPEIQEAKKPVLPNALRQLTPEETLIAFYDSFWEGKYDEAMTYLSPQNRQFNSKWDLQKARGSLSTTKITVKIRRETEYLDVSKTMAAVPYEIYKGSKSMAADVAKLQKEDGVWKILEI